MLASGKNENLIIGEYFLLLIGINEYANASRLAGSLNDVKMLEEILTRKYQFNTQHIIKLLDQEATQENIIEQLRRLTAKLKEEDSLIIFFSGHGSINNNGTGTWVTYDSRTGDTPDLDHETILSYIRIMKARHIVLISDSTFSAKFLLKSK